VAVVDLSQWKVESLIDAGAGVDGWLGRRQDGMNEERVEVLVWIGLRRRK
jgi:hypothetical protein